MLSISLKCKGQNSGHLAKSCILKSSPKFTCYTNNTVSDVYLFSLVLTQFTYFPQDVSETHTSLHSTEVNFALWSNFMSIFNTIKSTVDILCLFPWEIINSSSEQYAHQILVITFDLCSYAGAVHKYLGKKLLLIW